MALPDVPRPEDAHAVAERLREAVEEEPVPLPGGGSLRVTISVGLALSPDEAGRRAEPVDAVVQRADSALLLAKSAGRNQVTIERSAVA